MFVRHVHLMFVRCLSQYKLLHANAEALEFRGKSCMVAEPPRGGLAIAPRGSRTIQFHRISAFIAGCTLLCPAFFEGCTSLGPSTILRSFFFSVSPLAGAAPEWKAASFGFQLSACEPGVLEQFSVSAWGPGVPKEI